MILIDTRKKMNRSKGDGGIYDSHHIIPKCMGGSNFTSNKVLLTPREHFIAHLLLSKSVESQYVKKMYCALVRFMGKNSDRSGIKINSKTYQSIIENNRFHSMGKNNSFYGKNHTQETKNSISIKNKEYNLLNKNSFYGKKHTEETKKLLSIQKSNPIKVYFTDGTTIIFSQYKYLGTHLGKSEHLGCKLVKPQFQHLLKNYNILRIEKL
jgi:hypothetical protein